MIDRAKQLKDYVEELTKETNKNLHGSQFSSKLYTHAYTGSKSRLYCGRVFIKINLDKREPLFLNEREERIWESEISDISKRRFDMPTPILSENDKHINPYELCIYFNAPSEEEASILTPEKERILKEGFDKIKKYIEWYITAVRGYETLSQTHSIGLGKYFKGLETLNSETLSQTHSIGLERHFHDLETLNRLDN